MLCINFYSLVVESTFNDLILRDAEIQELKEHNALLFTVEMEGTQLLGHISYQNL